MKKNYLLSVLAIALFFPLSSLAQVLNESFNSSSLPAGWTQEYVSGTEDWAPVTTNGNSSISPRTGSHMGEFRTTSSGDATKLVTPSMDLTSLTTPQLTFYFANVNWFGDIDELRVYYKTSATGSWVQIGQDYITEHTAWEKVDLLLPSPSTDYYIAFEGTSNYARGLNLDDVSVAEAPTCLAPTALTATGMTTTSADLGWTDNNTPAASLWDVHVVPAGGPAPTATTTPSDPGLTANSYSKTGLSPITAYEFYVRADCGGGDFSIWSGPFAFTTLCPANFIPDYTQDFSIFLPDCWEEADGGDAITGPTTLGSGDWTFEDFLNTGSNQAANLNIFSTGDQSWLLSPEIDLSGGAYELTYMVAVTDWDNSNPETMGSDDVVEVLITTDGGTTWTVLETYDQANSPSATGTQEFIDLTTYTGMAQIAFWVTNGAVDDPEDYDFFIDDFDVHTKPSCAQPSALTATSVLTTSADLGWTDANTPAASTWDVHVVPAGDPAPTATTTPSDAGVSNPYTETGLTANTNYEFYVRANCGGGGLSAWSGPFPFTTLCNVVNTFPWTEDFESVTPPALPNCSTLETLSGDDWETDNVNESGFSSNVLEYSWNSSQNADTWFYTPGLDLTGGTTYELSFGYGNNSTTYTESLKVSYGTSASSTAMTNLLADYSVINTDSRTDVTISFTPSTTGTYYIGFNCYSIANQFNLWVDDISVNMIASCPEPTNLTAGVAATSASLGWTDSGSATLWDVHVVPAGDPAPTSTTVPSDPGVSNPYNKTGLTASTSYDFYVRADCGGGDLSVWSLAGNFLTLSNCPGTPLAITGSTPATVNCGGTATLTATASGTGDAIYWYDAAVGGNLLGTGPSFTTSPLSSTTTYYATEVLFGSGSGGTFPTYCTPSLLTNGCSDGDNIEDFTLLDSSGTKIIEHLATGCSTNNYGDYTTDPNLTGSLMVGDTYNFTISHLYQFGNQYVGIWIDLNANGSFADAGEQLFVSTSGSTGGSPTTGSISIPSSAMAGEVAMRVVDIYGAAPADACATGGSFGETHDYKITIVSVVCESPRTQVIATVNSGDKTVPSTTTPAVYTDTDDTANFSDSYSGAPGSSCGTTADYLGGNEVVYYYTAGDSYALNVAMSGLSAGESGVFVYDSCLDIGTSCIEGMTSTTATNYDFDMIVQSGEDYFIVVSSSAATGTLGYTLTLTETASPCLNLAITNTTGGTIPCIGKTTLTATASGIGNDIYWYDAATGGNLVGIGPNFQTPQLSATTSFWAAEVITTSGGGSGTLPTYCTPTFTSGCSGFGDEINDFTLSDSSGISVIDHIGSGCSANNYGDYTGDPSLTGVLIPGSTYNFTIGHNEPNQYVKIWIDIDKNGSFEDAGELLFTSTTGGNTTTGSITVPATATGMTAMRLITKYGSASSNSCTTNGTWGETHDYKVILPNVLCESPRMQATATIDTAGNITVTTPLPYSNTNDTANFGNPYEGAPGDAALCGTTENYLNGNDVVYYFTAQKTELVDIEMSNLSDFYGAVFVYGSCGDIYTGCLAGAVAGPSDNDFKINDFQVTAGDDYYIVVSSWLSSSIGYTLEIIPFDCANLPAPDGAATQDFVAGDTLSTLDATTTETGATLIWYAAASDIPANPIVGDPALVNGEDYFVTQLFNGCESAPLTITVNEIDCSMLSIISTTGDSTSCKGILTLTATASGTGQDIYWYTTATGGTPVGTGPQFTTPELTTTTPYWVSEVFATGFASTIGAPDPTIGTTSSSTIDIGTQRMYFDVGVQTTLLSVDIYPTSAIGSTSGIEIRDNAGATVAIVPYTTTVTGGSTPQTIPLNITLPPGTDYEMGQEDNNATSLTRNTTGASYPYASTDVQITGNSFDVDYYYFFYNWQISSGSLICESPRQQVDAVVNQTGDVALDYNDLAPSYTDTANTSNFSDKFSGDPGTGCEGAGILDGGDVVYQYTADPNNDDILDIELTGISNPNTGMYIYASCGDVGINCLAGGTNANSLDILIEDYYVTAGTEIFIVISSGAGSTNYTLNINGLDCANIAVPTINSPNPYFVAGDMLDVLESEIGFDQYGTLTWYSALPPSAANEIDPTTTPIVDGTTYYVTQTILGCESAPLAITPAEFQCNNMKIDTITPDLTICAPGGQVTLNAQGTGIGSELYWYDAATGGNVINIGNTLVTNVSTTTSFWVSEVFLQTSSGSSGGLQTYCVPSFTDGCSGFGDDIDDFILYGPGGTSIINHTGSGCSPNAYGDFTTDPNLTGTLVSGSTYNFDITSNYDFEYFTIWIDFNQNGSFADTGEQLYASPTVGPVSGTFTIPSSAMAGSTVMRVRAADGSPFTDACAQDSYGEAHDYKVNIIGQSVVCESNRTQVTVTVNDQPTDAPTGTATQKLCEGNTLADIAVAGTDIQWYSTATGGSPLGLGTTLQDGDIYYASQTLGACESGTRLEVTVFILSIAPMPTGAGNQYYFDGEHISDLDVTGTDLTWYEDEDKTQEITNPATFELENYETYYVSQAPAGSCESELLAITVHEELGTAGPLFAGLTYHPNPMKHKLTISNTTPMESVSLYDLRGRKIMQRKVKGNEISLDVSNLQAGAYFLRVKIDGKTGVFKLVKE